MTTRCAIALFLLLQLCYHGDGCPAQCQCFSAATVMCSEERMTSLPQNISSQVRELIVMTSSVVYIRADSFRDGLKLTTLVILSNPLRTICPMAFDGLLELEELEISSNHHLQALEVGTFNRLGNLTRLLLNNNMLRILGTGMFDSLQRLETLQLRGNALSHLSNLLFRHLHRLRTLDLSHNMISVVDGDLLSDLTVLKSLKLGFNQIGTLSPDAFKNASQLKELCLQRNQITHLPQGIFAQLDDLEELNLRGNRLTDLSPGTLPDSLKELYLQENQLVQLSSASFGSLPRLTHLSLSHNQLSVLPKDLFQNLTALQHLDLSENQLTSLPHTIFTGLSKINSVSLHKNNLSSLEVGLFIDQEYMERLYLSGNQLRSLPPGFFEPFYHNVVRLHGNPWSCDCRLLYLHEWLEYSSQMVEDLSKVYCDGPVSLRGLSPMSIDRDQLICAFNSSTPRPVPTNPSMPVAAERLPTNSTNQCSLQEDDGVFSIKCTVIKCTRLKLEAHFYGTDGSTSDYIMQKQWPESSQCANGTITLVV